MKTKQTAPGKFCLWALETVTTALWLLLIIWVVSAVALQLKLSLYERCQIMYKLSQLFESLEEGLPPMQIKLFKWEKNIDCTKECKNAPNMTWKGQLQVNYRRVQAGGHLRIFLHAGPDAYVYPHTHKHIFMYTYARLETTQQTSRMARLFH